eukprot:50979_1
MASLYSTECGLPAQATQIDSILNFSRIVFFFVIEQTLFLLSMGLQAVREHLASINSKYMMHGIKFRMDVSSRYISIESADVEMQVMPHQPAHQNAIMHPVAAPASVYQIQ